ncbi:hypothetical protein [Gemmobacter denitrificans]|uniref:AbiV family abortive infection protein n=1 Tax=Gemmobacter denitrificans TaxID=3123040 RepID=A0ABU8BR40_9RHOB
MDTPDWLKGLERLLADQDDELSRSLKVAALMVLAAEELRSCVEQKALWFFGLDKDLRRRPDGEPLPPEYQRLASKRQAERLQAASLWFQSVGAFDRDDVELVRLAMDYRNDVAHELFQKLIHQGAEFFNPVIPFAMVCLAHKVNLWWMQNYEFDGDDEYENVDWAKAEQASTAIVRLMTLAAFPELQSISAKDLEG